MTRPFVLWITGLPASGKSSIAAALTARLRARNVDPALLESDVFRKYFTPHATHSEADRTLFYQGMVEVAAMLVERGVPVILDATGNRRAYRAPARDRFPLFAEVFVDCPLEICMERDPKGLYHGAREGRSTTLPGLQAEYERPIHPEVHIKSDREDPEEAARKILDFLISSEWIPSRKLYRV
ncbi:MAG: adenylyl-sulfate kinase [Planctomycetes bacterium]|nr:adenylyl-sulfate kinase [Planctomycetota bacterium]